MLKTSKTMKDYVEEASHVTRSIMSNAAELTLPIVELCKSVASDTALPQTLWLVASGSSYNASYCALPFMKRTFAGSCNIQIVTPFSFLHYRHAEVGDKDLVLVVTQSGYSTNAIAALDLLRSTGQLAVCVTGDVEADAASHADVVVDYGVGIEEVGYVTKGVSALVVFLMMLAIQLTGVSERACEIGQALDAADYLRGVMLDFYENHAKNLTSMGPCYCCGVEGTWGIALESALKIGETVHIPSFAYEVEEYIHGPNLQLNPDYTVIFFDPNDETSERFAQMYKATQQITDRAFLLTANQAFAADPNAVVIPQEYLITPDTVSLAYLPFVQLLSFYVSDALGSTKQHPLLKKFKSVVAAKTEHWVNRDGDE